MAVEVDIAVANAGDLLNAGMYGAGALIRLQTSATETGAYADVTGTGSTPTTPLVSGTSSYQGFDPTGTSTSWYRTRYENAGATRLSDWSAVFQVAASVPSVYATLAALKSAVGVTDASSDDALELALGAASQMIRSNCQRDFVRPSGVTESRLFELGSYLPQSIVIDDLVDATGLVLAFDDGTGTYPTTITTPYDLTPFNAPVRGFPYEGISFRNYAVVPSWRLSGPLVKVTSARWGWPVVPAAVTQACLIQAARIFKRKDSPFGIAGSPMEGNVVRLLAKLDPDVEAMLGGEFQRWRMFVA